MNWEHIMSEKLELVKNYFQQFEKINEKKKKLKKMDLELMQSNTLVLLSKKIG